MHRELLERRREEGPNVSLALFCFSKVLFLLLSSQPNHTFLHQSNIGLPFYGRSFLATIGSPLDGFDQPFAGVADLNTWADDAGTPQFFNIMKNMYRFTSVRHEQTKTQFMYNDQGFVSYDDELAICDKAEYAVNNDLLGFIIWEISGKPMDSYQTASDFQKTLISTSFPFSLCGIR